MMNSRSSPLALATNGQGGSQGSEGAGAGKEEGSSVPNGRVFGLGAAPGLPLFLGAALLLMFVVAAANGLGSRGSAGLGELEEALRCRALSLLHNAVGLSN